MNEKDFLKNQLNFKKVYFLLTFSIYPRSFKIIMQSVLAFLEGISGFGFSKSIRKWYLIENFENKLERSGRILLILIKTSLSL